MAQYSQGSAFLDRGNLPSFSCRSNRHRCIKLLKKFQPVSLLPLHCVSILTDPGLVAQMVYEKKSTTARHQAFRGAKTHRRFMVHNGKVSIANKAEPGVIKLLLFHILFHSGGFYSQPQETQDKHKKQPVPAPQNVSF